MADPAIAWSRRLAAAPGRIAWAWLATHAELVACHRPDADAADLLAAQHRPLPERADLLLRRTALRQLAAEILDADSRRVSLAADQPPRFTVPSGTGLHLSMARRDGFCAFAVARSPVGIDIERVGAPSEPPWSMLTAEERKGLEARPADLRWAAFLRLWTGKEAYLKAIGTGLGRDPAAISVRLIDDRDFALADQGRPIPARAAEHHGAVLDGQAVWAACVALQENVGTG